jgi:hypothetical protein
MERKQSPVPPPSDHELILIDAESELLLYGHQIVERLIETRTEQTVARMRVAAETYLALLGERFSHVPESNAILPPSKKLISSILMGKASC